MTGGEEKELEVGKPSNEKGGEATKMKGMENNRKVKEDGNHRENEDKSCNSLWNSFPHAIAITQTHPY